MSSYPKLRRKVTNVTSGRRVSRDGAPGSRRFLALTWDVANVKLYPQRLTLFFATFAFLCALCA
jgi:hypothetical protein